MVFIRSVERKKYSVSEEFPFNLPLVRNLKPIDLSSPVTFLVGDNGSGKSTLLTVISGIMPPSEGKISYQKNSQEIHGDDVYKNISYSAPYMDLIEELTLEECLTFHLKFRKLNSGISFSEFFELAQLTAHKSKYINQFSSGMKQKVSIARAVIHDPALVVLDEPTTGLDIMATSTVMEFIQRLKDKGTPVIFSTHHLDEVQALCDKVTVINQGETVFNDSLEAFSALSGGHMHQSFLKTLSLDVEEKSNVVNL